MSEWKEYILENIVEKFVDYRGKTPNKTSSGIPLITAKIVKSGRLLEPNEFIACEDYNTWMTRGLPELNDVIITTEAPLGEVALLKDTNVALAQRIILIRSKKEICNSVFLKYYLESTIGQSELLSRASGSTVEGIKAAELKKINIILPALSHQNAIADILVSIDDKIDLLHRQNKTLEQLAETLFRQWFVEEAEEEWETIKLNDCFSVRGGTTPSTKIPEYWDGNINWTSPRDLSGNDFVYLFDTEKKITEKGLREIGSGLLPKGTVLLSSRAPIGYLVITEIQVAINQGYIAIICDKIVSNYFIYLWLKKNMETIINSANGSVFLEISKSTFKDLDIVIPPKKKLQMFDSIIEPLFLKIKSNSTQIKTLETLRDALLPRLINGEIILSN